MTAECGPGGEETGRLSANVSQSRSNDSSPGSRETETRIPAPLLDYKGRGQVLEPFKGLTEVVTTWKHWQSWALCMGPGRTLGSISSLPPMCPCLFMALCPPHHTPPSSSKSPLPRPSRQSDTCCFCCSNVSHMLFLLSIELLHQGNFQVL